MWDRGVLYRTGVSYVGQGCPEGSTPVLGCFALYFGDKKELSVAGIKKED